LEFNLEAANVNTNIFSPFPVVASFSEFVAVTFIGLRAFHFLKTYYPDPIPPYLILLKGVMHCAGHHVEGIIALTCNQLNGPNYNINGSLSLSLGWLRAG